MSSAAITLGDMNPILDRLTDDEYTCTLSPQTISVAKDELNEDAKDRLASVQALRQWLLQQPHITAFTDTVFLLGFLRTSKFSQLRARQMLTGYATSFTNYPEWFSDVDPRSAQIEKVLQSHYVVPLPKTDKLGRRIVIYRISAINADKPQFTMADELRSAMIYGLLVARNEESMVNGICFVFDCSGISLKHISRVKMDDMRKWNKAWQKNLPGRFKAFHYYNAGSLFDLLMTFFKPFMEKKFQERIHVHNTAESLYKAFDKELLPLEYLPDDYNGPHAGTIDQIVGDYKKYIQQDSYRNYMLSATGDTVRIDLSKKPQDVPEASFRKLNVD